MLLFAQAGSGHLIDAKLDTQQLPLLTAYGLANEPAEGGSMAKAVVFNKDADRAVHLTVDSGGGATRRALCVWSRRGSMTPPMSRWG